MTWFFDDVGMTQTDLEKLDIPLLHGQPKVRAVGLPGRRTNTATMECISLPKFYPFPLLIHVYKLAEVRKSFRAILICNQAIVPAQLSIVSSCPIVFEVNFSIILRSSPRLPNSRAVSHHSILIVFMFFLIL